MKKFLLTLVIGLISFVASAQLIIETNGKDVYSFNGSQWVGVQSNPGLQSRFVIPRDASYVQYQSYGVDEVYMVVGEFYRDTSTYAEQYVAQIRGGGYSYTIILDYTNNQVRIVNGYQSLVQYYITRRYSL